MVLTERKLIERLASQPLFHKTSKRNLKTVAQLGQQTTWAKGKSGVVEGSTAAAFYVILDGAVTVTKDGKQLARLQDDDFFGEVALLTGGERTATVTALIETHLFALSRSTFSTLVKTNSALAMQLMAAMVERTESPSY